MSLDDNVKSMSDTTLHEQQREGIERNVNPEDISVPPGFRIEALAKGLNTPVGIDFNEDGDLLIADSGILSGNPKVLLLRNGELTTIAQNFNVPITGITYWKRDIYVSHKGVITVVKPDGSKQDIIKGLPSYGDYGNNKVSFSLSDVMYFGQGTATNSGVVGLDNKWIEEYALFHDYPGSYIMLNGQNFKTKNILMDFSDETVLTGAFSPYGVPNTQKFEVIRGITKAAGSILRCNPDGSELEQVAWGFRNPYNVKFDLYNRLFVSNQGYESRGSRPIDNALDELQILIPGTWYGWPDYSGGESVTLPRFSAPNVPPLENLLTNHPSVPPKPFAVFPSRSNIMGFDFNNNPDFGEVGDIYIANFGSTGEDTQEKNIYSITGHRISKVDMFTGQVSTFAINKSGFPASYIEEGGFGRPTDVAFGPDGAMYISDFSTTVEEDISVHVPNTGVIWKVTKI